MGSFVLAFSDRVLAVREAGEWEWEWAKFFSSLAGTREPEKAAHNGTRATATAGAVS
jgi:hypothetical protein